MQIVVCMKQVPDTTQVRIDPETNTLIREGVPSIINPFDVHAIEEAARIKERYGAEVTLLCQGPPTAVAELQKGLSFAADRAILLTDSAMRGSDTLATSYILSTAIKRIWAENGLDLVLCGKQTIDGDTAQVGPGIGTRLSLSQLTYVDKVVEIDAEKRRIQVRRRLEGATAIIDAPMPALLTILKEANTPRYASLPALIKSLRTQPAVWNAADLELDAEQMGLNGSPTSVRRIFAPPERTGGEIIPGGMEAPERAAAAVVEKILSSGAVE
ncbi:MAG: electron transfer flavoprotein subunit beta [Armatimonadetes bacterium]|nr:electron transfer flavoprotein subunit beta [Armatimonadota bacterium]NIO74915.1 electron transfer flavoprotein subunit beta [Armatimonadota bacterium]NIO96616.1 electron transfer flavoprotein subunit beta [Armatimonadota bacterium]